jgi:hypothetical protein
MFIDTCADSQSLATMMALETLNLSLLRARLGCSGPSPKGRPFSFRAQHAGPHQLDRVRGQLQFNLRYRIPVVGSGGSFGLQHDR